MNASSHNPPPATKPLIKATILRSGRLPKRGTANIAHSAITCIGQIRPKPAKFGQNRTPAFFLLVYLALCEIVWVTHAPAYRFAPPFLREGARGELVMQADKNVFTNIS